jgi:MFS family permease
METDVTAHTSAADAAEAPWPKPAVGWYMVSVLMVAYIFSFIDRTILSLLVGPIRADLQISDTQFSLLHGFAFALFYTMLGIPVATLADRKNRRNIIAIGVTFWSLATAACGLTRDFLGLFLARVGVGVGEATISPAAFSMIADTFPEERMGRAMGVYSVGAFIGIGLAFIIGGVVVGMVTAAETTSLPWVGEVRPWQMVFFIVGMPGILVALWILTLREPVRRHSKKSMLQQAGLLPLLRHMRQFWPAYTAHLVGFSLLGLLFNAMAAWIPTYLIRTFGVTAGDAGLWLGGILLVFSTAGLLVGSWLTDRMRARGATDATMRVGLLSCICLLPFTLTATTVSSLALSLVLFAPLVFFSTFAWGAAAAAIQVITPSRMRATGSAIYLFFLNLMGIGCGPTLVAVVTDYGFGDDSAIGLSLAVVSSITAPVAALFIWMGLRSFRQAAAHVSSTHS